MKTDHSNHFVPPTKYYILTFVCLIFLTLLTVYTAKYIDLAKSGNIILAMTIVLIKTSLVLLFFMGLKWDKGINFVVLLFSLIFLFFFFGITMIDYVSRNHFQKDATKVYELQTPVKKKPVAKETKSH